MIPFLYMLIYNFQGIFTQIISFDPHNNSMKKEVWVLFASFYSWRNPEPREYGRDWPIIYQMIAMCLFFFLAYSKSTFPKILWS